MGSTPPIRRLDTTNARRIHSRMYPSRRALHQRAHGTRRSIGTTVPAVYTCDVEPPIPAWSAARSRTYITKPVSVPASPLSPAPIPSRVSDCPVPCGYVVHPEYAYSSTLLWVDLSLIKCVLVKKVTAAVWCVPALRVPLVHSLINHFCKKKRRRRNSGLMCRVCLSPT